MEEINGEYHYKGIFTVIYNDSYYDDATKDKLLSKIKAIIDAILSGKQEFMSFIMDSKFGDLNTIINILYYNDDKGFNEYFKMVRGTVSNYVHHIYIGELTITYDYSKHKPLIRLSFHDKSVSYYKCDECEHLRACDNVACDVFIGSKFYGKMTKSANN